MGEFKNQIRSYLFEMIHELKSTYQLENETKQQQQKKTMIKTTTTTLKHSKFLYISAHFLVNQCENLTSNNCKNYLDSDKILESCIKRSLIFHV